MRGSGKSFARLPPAAKLASVADFAGTLASHSGRFIISGKTPIESALLARGVKNILVGRGSSAEQIAVRLNKVLGLPIDTAVVLPEHAVLLFNVPEGLAGECAVLLTTGQVIQTATAESQYARVTLEDVKAGRTDFGEDMLRFMELNEVEFIDVLTQLTAPRYSRMGFAGSVSGQILGMRGDVGSWSTIRIGMKEGCGLRCYHCVIACPAGAIVPNDAKRGGVKIDPAACKGCQLCVEACPSITFVPGAKSE